MSANVQLKHIFGYRTGISGSVAFHDDHTVVYPSGSNLVVYNMDRRVQKFINGNERSLGMTAMAISPNRRYVALAEKTAERPIITIYDIQALRKKKVLWTSDIHSREYVSLAFSPDSKYLAAQCGNPDWSLIYWSWEKGKQLAIAKTSVNNPVKQISFNPNDCTELCVIGQGILRFYRYNDNLLKPYGLMKLPSHNFTCHSWVTTQRVAVGTDIGRCYMIENGESIWEVDVNAIPSIDHGKNSDTKDAEVVSELQEQCVTSVLGTSKGLAIACLPGIVHWFELSKEQTEQKPATPALNKVTSVPSSFTEDRYELVRTIAIPVDPTSSTETDPLSCQQITHLALSPSEKQIVCCTDANQLYCASSAPSVTEMADKRRSMMRAVRPSMTVMPSIGGLLTDGVERLRELDKFEPLSHQFHHGEIMGLDICARKPLIASCSTDRSVRIWNFETNSLEISKQFAEESYCIALHPTGLYVLVGFSDKLRLMNILIDDIRTYHEISIRGCRECAFSRGGHLLAAVNGNVIQIYSLVTFDCVTTLKGHNGKIRSLIWSEDDSKIISCGMDGAVYEWDLRSGDRTSESVLKSCSYSSISISSDSKSIYAVGSDKTLKEINDSQIVREVTSPDVLLTTVVLIHQGRTLICGTQSGHLRVYGCPITSDTPVYHGFIGHCAPIRRMKATVNNDLLITASEDCCIMIWRVEDVSESRIGAPVVRMEKEDAWTEEILITKSDLEEKNSLMEELKTRVDELKMENEYQLRLKDMTYTERIKELTSKFVQEMEVLRHKLELVEADRDRDRTHAEFKLREVVEKHVKEVQDLVMTSSAQLANEQQKLASLQSTSDSERAMLNKQLRDLDEAKSRKLEETCDFYEVRLTDQKAELDALQRQMAKQGEEHEVEKNLIEEDSDREILEIKIRYERRLRDERETNARLKGEAGIMNKKFTSLQKEIDEHKEEIRKFNVEINKLNAVIRSLEKDIQGLKKEIQERDETIQDKEKRIYDLKKKNQELEKFRFVLDYKNKELKKQIEPREADIKNYREQIQEMEGELERFHKQTDQLEINIAQMKQKHRSVEIELNGERHSNRVLRAVIRRFKTDLYHCVRDIQEPKVLKQNIVGLYKKYLQDDVVAEKQKADDATADSDIQKEFGRQREHLEKSVIGLRKKLANDSEGNRANYITIMQENVTLMGEINNLRKELKLSRGRINELTAALGVNRRDGDKAAQLLLLVTKGKQNVELEEDFKTSQRMVAEQQKAMNQLHQKLAKAGVTGTLLASSSVSHETPVGGGNLAVRKTRSNVDDVVGASNIDEFQPRVGLPLWGNGATGPTAIAIDSQQWGCDRDADPNEDLDVGQNKEEIARLFKQTECGADFQWTGTELDAPASADGHDKVAFPTGPAVSSEGGEPQPQEALVEPTQLNQELASSTKSSGQDSKNRFGWSDEARTPSQLADQDPAEAKEGTSPTNEPE